MISLKRMRGMVFGLKIGNFWESSAMARSSGEVKVGTSYGHRMDMS